VSADFLDQITKAALFIDLVNRTGFDNTETVLGAITLTALSEATVAVSHKLVRASTRDTLDLEREVDMLEDTVVSVAVQVLHQSERILGVTVVTDTCDLSDSFNGVRGCLYECYLHGIFPPCFQILLP
jgi:hypothetical protein